jgi:hypothetical protein
MEKNSLLTFFEVLSSIIKCWVSPKNTISTLVLSMFEDIISVDSQSELGKKKHRALGFFTFNKPSLTRYISCGQITALNTTVIAPVTTQMKWGNYLFSSNKITLFVILILFSTNSFAQVVLPPSDIDCPSKDLEVTGAILPAPANDPCSCSGTRTLQLGIINKTGSDRTSFAMWGKLIRKDASGNTIGLPVSIFACASGIDKLSTKFYTTTATIDVHCNESIDIIDVILAWTSSNNKETCEVLRNNPSTINPKCGRVNSIRVETGVDASFNVINATCTSNGSIQVSPFGGIAPYKVKIGNVERTGIAAGGSTTFSLPAGDYDILLTDNRPCSSTRSRTIGSSSVPTVSAGTAFKKTCADNTNGGSIGETAVTGFSYSWSSSPAGFSSSSANPTVNPTVTTVYTVRKTNSATNCYADASVTVTVENSTPTVSAGTAFKKTCTANTNGGSIGETAVSGFSYSWSSSPAGFSSSSANPTVNPTVTTVYTVRKTNSATDCYADASVTVTVDNSTPIVSAGTAFKKTCTANTNGGSIGETAVSGFSYSWSSNPAGFSSSSANPTVNPTVTTVYTVRKTNSETNCYADASVTVTVDTDSPDTPTFCVVQPSLCSTAKGSVTINSPCGVNYEYSIKNGNTGTWQPAILFDNLNPGDVTGIRVRNKNTGCVSNAASCNASDCVATPCPSTSGKIANTDTKTTAIGAPIEAKTTTVGFDAYPVPFKDQLTIKYKFDYTTDVKIEVFNAQGISVLSKTDTNSYLNKEIALDLKFNRGKEQLYLVKVTTNRGSTTKKIMSSK